MKACGEMMTRVSSSLKVSWLCLGAELLVSLVSYDQWLCWMNVSMSRWTSQVSAQSVTSDFRVGIVIFKFHLLNLCRSLPNGRSPMSKENIVKICGRLKATYLFVCNNSNSSMSLCSTNNMISILRSYNHRNSSISRSNQNTFKRLYMYIWYGSHS